MAKVAFIGLGAMGYPMAGHLVRAGHSVAVYNRTPDKASHWLRDFSGRQLDTPREAAQNADFVMTCVGNDDDLRDVVLGQHGALYGMSPGSILIDHTTVSADLAKELALIANNKGVEFLDAPVSGGQVGAESGRLTIMVGGDQVAYERAKPVLDSYAQMSCLMGGHGAGQLSKMVNQICVAGLIQGLAEALHFAQCAGVDGMLVMDVISKGAAQSWQQENRHKTMLEGQFDFGFAVDWMRKDLSILLTEARKNGAQLPVTALVDQFYADIQSMGGGRWDTSSLIARLKKS